MFRSLFLLFVLVTVLFLGLGMLQSINVAHAAPLAVANNAVAQTLPNRCQSWRTRSLPPCFPKNVPIHSGMELAISRGNPASGQYFVQGTTRKGVKTVSRFYQSKARSLGWKQIGYANQAGNDLVRLHYRKGTSQFTVTLQAAKPGTLITLETNEIRPGRRSGVTTLDFS